MKDPTRLAAIKALKPTPNLLIGNRDDGSRWMSLGYPLKGPHYQGDLVCSDGDVSFFYASRDPEYGLQALAAEVERLQEREKPVVVMLGGMGLWECPSCQKSSRGKSPYCPNCGRKLEWK